MGNYALKSYNQATKGKVALSGMESERTELELRTDCRKERSYSGYSMRLSLKHCPYTPANLQGCLCIQGRRELLKNKHMKEMNLSNIPAFLKEK